MLKCTKQRPRSVCTLLDKVNGSDEQLEGNLSTVLQSVRGSKQYWFFRQGEVRCMIREFGSPTLFLTLRCAEYESPEIISYLRKVNTVPSSYDMEKLCTEDPISVSRKFLIKFQAFFAQVLCVLHAETQVGSTFVTRCRFQFPRQACEAASLNSVEDSLKPRKKVYNLPRTEKEERVNDYSPCSCSSGRPTWTSSSPQRRR